MSGFDELASELDRVAEALPRAAAAAAPKLLAVVHAQHAAGQAPDGTAWPLTVDGRVALTDLTSQITARADGGAIVLAVPDLLKPHQVGTGRLPKRQVMPAGELPDTWKAPIDKALAAELGEPR